jgi:hypothetical protein
MILDEEREILLVKAQSREFDQVSNNDSKMSGNIRFEYVHEPFKRFNRC